MAAAQTSQEHKPKLLYLVTEDWSFLSHRLPMARAAQAAGFEVVVVARCDKAVDKIQAEGFRLIDLPWKRGGMNPLQEIREIIRIYKIYRREAPAIVHHVALKPALHGSLAAWAAKVPSVINALTGLGFIFIGQTAKARLLRAVITPLLRWLLNRPNSFLLMQNEDDGETLKTCGILSQKTEITLIRGSGVDIQHFTPASHELSPHEPSQDSPKDDIIEAALVARMLWDKGIGEAVEAARLLKARKLPFRLRLVGPIDPENGAAITEHQIQEWVAAGLVLWDGPRQDIATLWQHTAIALLPSYREGLPKALLEAAACGRPMVATDVPGCRDICRDGRSGLLVPLKDAEALANALETLITNPSLRHKFGAGARELVETRFSDKIIAQQISHLYAQALAKSPCTYQRDPSASTGPSL